MRLPGIHRINGRKLGHPVIHVNDGKGGGQAMLPDRTAMHKLLGGSPSESALGNYSKATPTGANALRLPGFLDFNKYGE